MSEPTTTSPAPADPISAKPEPKTIRIKRLQIGVNVLVQTLIVLVLLLMLNYLSFRHFKRWDYSRDQQYALSSQTKNLLTSLKKPIQSIIFFSTAAEIAPDLSNLLREYEFASGKKFTVEIVDPYRNLTRAQELATKYKIRENDNIVILDYGGKNKFVNAADMAEFDMPDQMQMMMGQAQPKLKAFKGEQAITSALLELTSERANKFYFVTGHGEPETGAKNITAFQELLKRQNIENAPLSLLNVSTVPEDARGLVIAGPKTDFSELEMKLLSDYWAKNGRLFVMLNAATKTPRLDAFLSEQGITPQGDVVMRNGTFLSMGEGGAPKMVTQATPQAVFLVLDSKTPVTRDLETLSKQFLGMTESLAVDQAKAGAARVRVTPLLQSGEGAWGDVDPVIEGQRSFFDPKKDHQGPLTLAAAAEKGGMEDNRVKVETARLVVVGNSEMITDNGFRASEGVSGSFALNALNWLLDREEATGIPPKEKKTSTFNLDSRQMRNIWLTTLLLIPGIVALLGIGTYYTRRA